MLLIDLSNTMYRSYFANRALHSSTGFPTGALFGLCEVIGTLRRKYPERRLVFAMDGQETPEAGRGWRFQEYKGYKANRKRDPSVVKDMNLQRPKARAIIRSLGHSCVEVGGLEADDLIGLLARSNDLAAPLIVSGDHDFYQLIGRKFFARNVKVLDPRGWKVIDWNRVEKTFEVTPRQWTRYRALTGDPSDNIPGLYKVGPKNAVRLLNAGADPSLTIDRQPDFVRRRYAKYWSKVRLSYRLSRIVTNIDNEVLNPIRQNVEVALESVADAKTDPDKFVRLANKLELNQALSNRRLLFCENL